MTELYDDFIALGMLIGFITMPLWPIWIVDFIYFLREKFGRDNS